MDVQKEINELRRKLNYYGKLYYVDDAPAISDYCLLYTSDAADE